MNVSNLLFIDKIKSNKQAFGQAVIKYANTLGYNPDWLMFIMNIETNGTFRPDIQNSQTKATGLIQFLPTTAEQLNTSVDELKNMSNVEQLEYVYKYYKYWKNLKPQKLHDVTLIAFYPYAIGKALDYIIGSEKSMERAKKIAKQNPILDNDKDGLITIEDYLNAINSLVDTHVKNKVKADILKINVSVKKNIKPKNTNLKKSIYELINDLMI